MSPDDSPPPIPDAPPPQSSADSPPSEETWESLLLTHSHDGFVKALLSDPRQARALFSQYLPAKIIPQVDFDTLRLEPTSFVEQSLRQTHSDLVFTADLRSGNTLKIFILFEHQTTKDQFMALRMLSYVMEILRQWIKDRKAADLPTCPLPVVFPFLLSQGPERWTVSTQFKDLFALSEEMVGVFADFLPKFQYHVLDLTTKQPEVETQEETLRAALYLMKLARQKDQMMEWITWLDQQTLTIEEPLLKLLLLYALHCEKTIDMETLRATIWKNENLANITMSLAEKLISEGEARGEARGIVRGEARGVVFGRLQLLSELMGKQAPTKESVEKLSLEELQTVYEQLQAAYNREFKH